MSIEFRSERPGDEAPIDVVECRAFRNMDEANLVRMYRERYPAFDRRYSICAWDGDELVGHALFLPFEMNLMGRRVKAVALSPDGVIPERQRQGIGTAMNRHGLDVARKDGFAVAVTNGDPAFYRRLGYKSALGFARVTIDRDALPEPSQELGVWPVRPEDVPWLVKCHDAEWADVDFAWNRGDDIREWAAPFACTVIWRTLDGRRAAYVEGLSDGRGWSQVLGDDAELVRDVLAAIKPLQLAQHPSGWLARNVLEPEWAPPKRT
jgi:putative acetyltransferase